jgi:hypothetical protein
MTEARDRVRQVIFVSEVPEMHDPRNAFQENRLAGVFA